MNKQDLSLTYQMIEDYAPYIKDPQSFRNGIIKDIEITGPVVRIENVYSSDGNLFEKRYYFSNMGDSYRPLSAIHTYLDSLPPTPGAENIYM